MHKTNVYQKETIYTEFAGIHPPSEGQFTLKVWIQ